MIPLMEPCCGSIAGPPPVGAMPRPCPTLITDNGTDCAPLTSTMSPVATLTVPSGFVMVRTDM